MKFHLTQVIEDRSAAAILEALVQCLKQEAWQIERHRTQVVALGIGTSRGVVNLSDNATFDIASSAGCTTIQVEVEYQLTWFRSEEIQNDTVRARFNAIFANLRAALNLLPGSPVAWSEAEQQLESTSRSVDSPETHARTMVAIPAIPGNGASETDQPIRRRSNKPLLTELPIHDPSHRPVEALSMPPDLPRRIRSSTVFVIVASLSFMASVVFGMSYLEAHHSTTSNSKPSPSAERGNQTVVSPSASYPNPPASVPSTNYLPAKSTALTTAPSVDPGQWLERWAASERTRDAKTQASFYADQVHPYLTRGRASRYAVYQSKQDSILNRKGLWTFNIEDVSVRKEGPEKATVLLKKHFMTQTGSVRVSEQRISCVLTLQRTAAGWQITGERDLQ